MPNSHSHKWVRHRTQWVSHMSKGWCHALMSHVKCPIHTHTSEWGIALSECHIWVRADVTHSCLTEMPNSHVRHECDALLMCETLLTRFDSFICGTFFHSTVHRYIYVHVCICMYVCVYVYVYVYVCIHICYIHIIYMYIYKYICIHIYINVYIYIYTYILMYMYMYIYVYTYSYVYIYIYVCVT